MFNHKQGNEMRLSRDKKLHAIIGVLVPLWIVGVYWTCLALGLPLGSFIGAITVHAAKEILDRILRNGTPEWQDFLVGTVASASICSALYVAGF